MFDEFNFSITLTNNEMNTDALNGRFHTKSSANNLDYNQLPLIQNIKKAWKLVKYKIKGIIFLNNILNETVNEAEKSW